MGFGKWLASKFASDRSPWGDFWFESVGTRTISGMRVSADTAMQLSAVYRAVSLLSGHMALLPVKFYKKGTRKRINKHPVLTLLTKRPNRFQNAFEWREMIQGHIELRGNAYNEIIANSKGQITELIPRHPDKVTVEQLESGDYRYKVTNPDGTTRYVPRGSMWHLRGISSNGITGMSVIECARESFGLGLAAQSYGARFFANDAKPSGGWIEYPGQFKDKEARAQFREAVQEAQSAANRGKLMTLDRGMKYHEVGVNNSDAQFLETKKNTVSDIARWFGVPPHKIGDLDRSTNNNIEQQALEYIQDGLLPRAVRWSTSIEAELLFDDEEIDVEFDFTILLRGDSTSRANYITKMVNGGILTRNEGREIEGREPLPGLDEPLRPLNMVEESEAEDEEADAETVEPKKTEQKELENSNETAMRLRALQQSNAERLARRFAKSGVAKADAQIIADALAVPLNSAEQFCSFLSGVDLADDEKTLTAMLVRLGEKI